MITTLYVLAGALVLSALYFIWTTVSAVYRKYGGKMLVMCPETRQTAGVSVDVKYAAKTAVLREPELQLASCTRWPERRDCDQECRLQVEAAPGECMVRTMLANWYRDKPCVFCGKIFHAVDSYDHKAAFWYDKKPGLLSPDSALVEWAQVPVESLPETLGTHRPVCWDCLIAETFRRRHPERVVDRS